MRLNSEDAAEMAKRFIRGTASAEDVAAAIAINRELFTSRGSVTLADAHILATHTTQATRLWDFQAQEGHMQTAMAMQDPDGSLYDFDALGEPVRFKSWRELVKVENDPQWGNQYVGPFAERGNV